MLMWSVCLAVYISEYIWESMRVCGSVREYMGMCGCVHVFISKNIWNCARVCEYMWVCVIVCVNEHSG